MVVCDPKVNTSFHAAKGLVPIKVCFSVEQTHISSIYILIILTKEKNIIMYLYLNIVSYLSVLVLMTVYGLVENPAVEQIFL